MDTPALASPKTSAEILDMYYLEMRSHILELAAIVDRIERAADGVATLNDPRAVALLNALGEIKTLGADRTERILHALSV